MSAIERLHRSTTRLASSSERLSSGMRINRASDDPAGLALTTGLAARSRILGRAQLNVNDALSLLTIADSAMSHISDLVTRMAELAEQAANGSVSSTQRKSINAEYSAMDLELRRIAQTTKFNGVDLLAGQRSADTGVARGQDDYGFFTSISADGRFVAWRGGHDEEFVIRDSDSGVERRVGLPAGTGQNGGIDKIFSNGDMIFSAGTNNVRNDIYYYSYATGQSRKLTNSSSWNDGGSTVSDDGSTLVFMSETHYTDGGTVSSPTTVGNLQLTTLDIASGTFHTYARDFSSNETVFSSDGSKIAFRTTEDLTGENSDASDEVFLLEFTNGQAVVKQVTHGDSALVITGLGGVSNDGKIYLNADFNYAPITVNTNLYEINSVDLSRRALTTGGSGDQFAGLTLSADGTKLFFQSTRNLTGESNLGDYHLFEMDLAFGTTRQLSTTTELVSVIAGDGSRALCVGGNDQLYDVDLTPRAQSFSFEAGQGARGAVAASLSAVFSAIRGSGAYTLTSAFSARLALDRQMKNLEAIAAARGVIGASMSRLASTESLVSSQRLYTDAANGRVRDTDVASEVAELTKSEILQQIGASIVAQANQIPALALTLLK